MTGRRALLLGLLLLAAAPSARGAAQSGDASASEPPLQYRRVLVPQEDLAGIARGYRPLQREAFDALLAQIEAQGRPASGGAVWIHAAEYHATFADGQLLDGDAALQVTHAADAPVLLSLAPWDLPAGAGVWHLGESSQPATLGTDAAGNLLALVPVSGTLHVPWTLRGTVNEWGTYRFDLALAAAPMSRLVLHVPAELEVSVDRGLIASPTELDDAAAAAPDAGSATAGGLRRWVIRLGGQTRCTVTVTRRPLDSRRQQLVNVQQDTTYRLADNGLEIACLIGLDIHREPLTELQLDVDSEVQITAIRLGDVDVDWSSAPRDDGSVQTVRVQFAERLTGLHSGLEVLAISPLHTDVSWKLPAFRPRNVFWRQGTMTLVVPRTLTLRHLAAHDARQSAVTATPDETEDEQLGFELFGVESALELTVIRQPRTVVADVGTTVDLDVDALTAETCADLTCACGERFVVEAQVPNAWTIDGIESEPATAVRDYQVVAYEAEYRRLQIQLLEPLTPDRPIRLRIRAHRSPSFPVTAEAIRPVEFLDTSYGSRLVAVTPDADYRLELTGDSRLERVDPAGLTPAAATRIESGAGGVVFVDNDQARPLRLNIAREDPEFAAAVYVDVEVDQASYVEGYRIVCTPDASPVTQLRVHLSEVRQGDLPWQFIGDGNAILDAHRVNIEQDAPSGLHRTGEVWDITLRKPQATPFEVRAQRTTRSATALNASLATLPAAVSHEGRLMIRSMDGTRLAVKASAVKPIPVELPPPGSYPTSRASYRFDASHKARVTIDRASARGDGTTLWVWTCQVASQYLATGEATHVATFLLENTGGTELQVRLPADCTWRGLLINGLDAGRAARPLSDGTYSVTLPAGCRFPRVALTYGEFGRRPGIWGRLATEFPQVNVPVMERRWLVWLPPGYRPAWDGPDGTAVERPTWKQRLLGPLSTGSDGRPFRLFSREDWLDLIGQLDRRDSESGHAPALLQSLGQILLAARSDLRQDEMTWRELFDRYRQRAEDAAEAPAMWIDAAWLADEGLRLDDTLPRWTGGDAVEVAADVLGAARLVLVFQDDAVLLTSLDGLARQLLPADITSRQCVAVAHAGGWLSQAGQSSAAYATSLPPGVVPLSAWVSVPGLPGPPWAGYRDATQSGLADRGWCACELPVDDAGHGTLTVEHSRSLWVVGWSLLLIVAGLVGGWGWRLGRYLYPILGAAAVVALLVPPELVPITSILCPATLLGMAVASVRRLNRMAGPAATRSDSVVAAAEMGTLLLIAVGLVALCASGLQAHPLQAASAPDTVYQVLVPVDTTSTPVGQYDYLPLEFYEALQARASRRDTAGNTWFLRQAVYRAIFSWRQQRSTLDLTSLTAEYQLEVLRAPVRIEFPWDGGLGGAELLEARLDGQPVELVWNAARTAFTLPVTEAGTCPLELVLRPEAREELGERMLRLTVPPVARSELQVELPSGASGVRVASARGSSYVNPETGTQHTDLGPIKDLELRWPSGAADNAAPQPMDVQQLMWLKVHPKDQPDTVMLETKLRAQATARRIDRLTLRIDPRLRLVTDSGPPPYEWSETPATDSGDRMVTIRLHRPVENELNLHLRFHVTNTTGLGNVSLPRVEPAEGRLTRRSLAVSVSPDLEFTAGTSDVLSPLEASEFLALWGEAESAPNLCYRISAEDPGWSLATRSRQPRSESEQTVEIVASQAGFEFSMEADINTVNGEVYQHRLAVPREFQLTSVAVLVGDADVAKAVEHDGSGTVTVFLQRGVMGAHRLILRGSQPAATAVASVPLPSVSMADVVVRGHTVHLFRLPDVSVEVQTPAGLHVLPQFASGTYHTPRGRLVTAFELTEETFGSGASVTVSLQPNEPRVDGRLVTTLRRTGDRWEAIADLEARVASGSGLADEFRFEIPAELAEPLTCEPAVPHEVRVLPGPRRQLIVRPQSPITDWFQLRVRGMLELGANERGRTPNIVPLDMGNVERFFVLPTQLDQQRVNWETPGLMEVPLADVVPEGATDPATHVAYRVWSKPRAVIADVQRVAGQRRISLADVYVDCQADGRCYGVVMFAIEPAGISSCTLEIPADLELVHAALDSVPAALVPLSDRRWQLRLASEQLPQQLTVAFRGQLAPLRPNQPRPTAVPWITDLDVARTLWTVRGSAGGELRVADGAGYQVSGMQQELRRLRDLASLVASAADTVLDSPARDIQAWYTPWAVRLACSGARIAHTQWPATAATGLAETEDVESIFQQQDAIAQRLRASPTVRDFARQTTRHPQASDVWRLSRHAAADVQHYDFKEHVPALPLVWQPDVRPLGWPVFWAVLWTTLLGLGLYLLRRYDLLALWWQRWPTAVGVLIGLAWWLLAWPSLLGWLIVAVSLWGAVRVPFVTQRAPAIPPESTADATLGNSGRLTLDA